MKDHYRIAALLVPYQGYSTYDKRDMPRASLQGLERLSSSPVCMNILFEWRIGLIRLRAGSTEGWDVNAMAGSISHNCHTHHRGD
jgi:hypothetical protein